MTTVTSEMEEIILPYFDRSKEIKAFDDTKAGVKGLVDAAITKIPRIFYNPPDNYKQATELGCTDYVIPVIDLSSICKDPNVRETVVERVRDASEKWGFFQVVNHGIPLSCLNNMIDGVQKFFEQDCEVKKEFYTRDQKLFMYYSNFNLYGSPTTTWRDTFFWNVVPNAPKPEDLPSVCRDILFEYSDQVMQLGTLLFELLSEALGLNSTHLVDNGCTEGLFAFGHYYPACPEPELTLGTIKHSDANFLTVLLQSHVGGLQILHQDMWVDVPPVPGALVVNIGDFLQFLSNDKFKSNQHRVLANNLVHPRVSVASFFGTGLYSFSSFYGPIKELLSEENPAKYRETSVADVVAHYKTKLMGYNTPPLQHFRI